MNTQKPRYEDNFLGGFGAFLWVSTDVSQVLLFPAHVR